MVNKSHPNKVLIRGLLWMKIKKLYLTSNSMISICSIYGGICIPCSMILITTLLLDMKTLKVLTLIFPDLICLECRV